MKNTLHSNCVGCFFNVHYSYLQFVQFCDMDFYDCVEKLKAARIDVTSFERYLNESYVPFHIREAAFYLFSNIDTHTHTEFVTSIAQVSDASDTQTIAQLNALNEERILLHKRHADLHSQLYVSQSKQERYEIIVIIMREIKPRLDAIYDALRKKNSTGKLATSILKKNEDSEAERVRKLYNIRTRISRLHSLIANETDPQRKAKLETERSEKIAIRDSLVKHLQDKQ